MKEGAQNTERLPCIATKWVTFVEVVIRMTSQQQYMKLEDVGTIPSKTEGIFPSFHTQIISQL